MSNITVGFLPLYVKLYDDTCAEMRPQIERFNERVIKKLRGSVKVVAAPICRIKSEFEDAVKLFESNDVDAIVTMHLAYSPSLESAEVLSNTDIPIVVLDTTEQFNFGPTQETKEIMYNHGIHGVQDMCNLLLRNHKKFFIEAGHCEKSDVIDRVILCVDAIKIAKSFRNARVGVVGEPFKGMGDFQVPFSEIRKTFGSKIVEYDFDKGYKEIEKITKKEMDEDLQNCKKEYDFIEGSEQVFYRSAPTNLYLRKWIEENKLTAMTVNFLAAHPNSGLPIMPFLEISRAMARGIGFAGEGDVLTAILVGAVMSVYRQTTFSEMFCPDWKGNRIFVSHMGEVNINLTDGKAMIVEKDFPFTDAENPIVAYGRLKPGAAVLSDIAPIGDNQYALILTEAEMLDVDGDDNMQESVHGWFRPKNMNIGEFLKNYSLNGGTHHFAITYGDVVEELKKFGMLMGFKTIRL